MRAIFLSAVFLVSSAVLADDSTPVDPGELFLEAFSSCPSRGVFTQRALRDNKAIQKILEAIKDDKACQGIAPVFRTLIDVNQEFNFLDSGLNNNSVSGLQAYANRLSYQIAIASSQEEKNALAQELAGVKVEIVRGPLNEQEQARVRSSLAVQKLVTYLDVIERDYANQLLCFDRHQSLPIQLAGQLISIAGGFFDPAVNLALKLSGRLLATFFRYFDDRKIVRKIEDFRKTTLQSGLTCAMESLEQTICDIQDRRALIEEIQTYRKEETIPEGWMGYELLTREFRTVQTFLRGVEAGSPAGSESQGHQKAGYYERRGQYDAARKRVEGIIGQAELEISEMDAANVSLMQNRIRRALESVMGNLMLGQVFQTVIPAPVYDRGRLWLRLGDPNVKGIDALGDAKSPYTILQELDSDQAKPGLQSRDAVTNRNLFAIRQHLRAIFLAAEAQLEVERQINVLADTQAPIVGWSMRNGQTFSPGVIMEKLIGYLARLEGFWRMNPQFFDSNEAQRDQLDDLLRTRSMFDTTLKTLRTSNDEIIQEEVERRNGVLPPAPAEKLPDIDPFAVKLKKIYEVMVLKERDQVISDRVRRIVQMDLEKRLRSGLLIEKESLDAVIRLGLEDVIASLIPGSSDRLEPLKEDLDEGEVIARDNLLHFFKNFRESIRASIAHLSKQAASFGENEYGVATRKISKLCILALNDPLLSENKQLIADCDLRVLGGNAKGNYSYRDDGSPIYIQFRKEEISSQTAEKRLCSFRRFRNEVELQEDVLRHRPKRYVSDRTPQENL